MAHYAIPSEREFEGEKAPTISINGLASTMNKNPQGPKKGLLGKILKVGIPVLVVGALAYPTLKDYFTPEQTNIVIYSPNAEQIEAFNETISQPGYQEVPVMEIPQDTIDCNDELDRYRPQCNYLSLK